MMSGEGHVKFYCRGSQGVWRVNGSSEPYGKDETFVGDSSKDCKCLEFSLLGDRVAWYNGSVLKIYDTVKNELMHTIDCAPLTYLAFSPQSTSLATWRVYSVGKGKQAQPNLHVYNVATAEVEGSFYQKKAQQWKPQWSVDEKVFSRVMLDELRFYEDNDLNNIKHKLHMQKVTQYTLAQNNGPNYSVAVYVPGTKGLPSTVRVYKYPNLGGHSAAVASKSFFKADRVTMEWNPQGTAMLILTSTESSDSSYYGEQGLHFLAVNGDSCVVPLTKNGPIYNIAWHPAGHEFTVLYGYMPAKCTIFNMKNNPVFDFGTGPRNQLFYNPFGNILCLAGFGNLQGNLEFWDLSAKKLISTVSAKDATCFQWAEDGCHALTATLSPRIRVGNGYKIWHYTGSLMKQENLKEAELYQAAWAPAPPGSFKAPTISYTPVPTRETAPAKNSAPAYRPPGAKGQPSATKLHEYELPSNQKKAAEEAVSSAPLSKNQKRKRAKAAATAAAVAKDTPSSTPAACSAPPPQSAPVTPAPPAEPKGAAAGSLPHYVQLTGDAEKDKRIKNLSKKLQQIQKLKDDQAAGVVLQSNQLDKLKKEDEVIEELERLSFG